MTDSVPRPDITIPEEAVEAAAETTRRSMLSSAPVEYWTREARAALTAAAPLIVAARLVKLADYYDLMAEAFEAPRMGTPASGMVTVLADLAVELRDEAAALRVGSLTHKDGQR
jgi:hypothetical protein